MVRDMTSAQFSDALKRNGFERPVMFWVHHRDLPNISFSMVFRKNGKLLRRLTIAHLIKRRDEELAKRK